MLCARATEYEYFVQVNKNEVQTMKCFVHYRHKGLCGVAEPETHAQKFEGAERSHYCRFGDAVRMDGHLEVAAYKVNLAEDSAAS